MVGRLIAVFTLCLGAQTVAAAELIIRSGEAQVGLLELYTSEGCSSCPPADRWLSALKQHADLWTRFVPIGLHVDYWDYIGWKDRFASPNNSRRQRLYAQHDHVSTVYTPGFIYNGREWRNWFGRSSSKFPGGNEPGKLELSIADGVVQVQFLPTVTTYSQIDVNVALLGFGISTAVDAGENAGRQLNHDFIVLDIRNRRLDNTAEQFGATVQLPTSQFPAERYAIAAWVSKISDPSPLQAAGGWLPDGMQKLLYDNKSSSPDL